MVFVLGPDLQPRDPINLQAASVNGIAPVLRSAAVSRDGSLLFVASGTAHAGSLFGFQPARLLVVDAASGTLLHDVSLPNDWAAGWIFPY